MKSRWFVALMCVCSLLPWQQVLGQCSGTCATAGSCPLPSQEGQNGCGSGVCCYCCTSCQLSKCGPVICTDPMSPNVPFQCSCRSGNTLGKLYYAYQTDYYNCYIGSNCTYDHTETNVHCGSCTLCDTSMIA